MLKAPVMLKAGRACAVDKEEYLANIYVGLHFFTNINYLFTESINMKDP